MLYFNANAGDFLNIMEHPLPLARMRSHLPRQPQSSPQMLSDSEDEDPFNSTFPQLNSGEFVCTYVCVCVCVSVCVCECVSVCASLESILQTVIMLLSLGMCDVLHYKHFE